MKTQDLRGLFPVTVEITQKMIDEADIFKSQRCIGALALKSAMPSNTWVSWAIRDGHVAILGENKGLLKVTTRTNTDMMKIDKPTTISFILI